MCNDLSGPKETGGRHIAVSPPGGPDFAAFGETGQARLCGLNRRLVV